MNKLNPFNQSSVLYPYRWFVLYVTLMTGVLCYYDLTGRKLFRFSGQQQWVNSGPSYHK